MAQKGIMRIGILTFHRAYNCGAMLQAWALKTVLERIGHAVEFPICNHVGETPRWQIPWMNPDAHGLRRIRSLIGRTAANLLSIPNEDLLRFRYAAFRQKYLTERNCSPVDFGRHYDLIIVGSDQVWNERITESDAPLFFGECLPGGIRRIAYAVSCGDQVLGQDEMERVGRALENFSAVSVREKLARDQISAFSGKDIEETLDPTLLLAAEDYNVVVQGPVPTGEYLFMYTLEATDFFVNTAKELSHRLGVRCVMAPCYLYSRYGAPKGLTYGISPDRLVQYVRNAKYVLAGSFHGTVLGALFNKPFLALRGQVDEFESRPAALLRKLGCENRLVNPTMTVERMCQLLISPLPNLEGRLADMRVKSMNWLQEAISA